MVQHVRPTEGAPAQRPAAGSVGPRSDAAQLAQAKLMASPYSALRALTCDSHEGVLAIRGRVPTFYLKQLAQVAVRDVAGVEVINNLVQVSTAGTTRTANRPEAD